MNRYGFSVVTWQRVSDCLPEKRQAPLIAKIEESIQDHMLDEIVEIDLTVDEEYRVSDALTETAIPPKSG